MNPGDEAHPICGGSGAESERRTGQCQRRHTPSLYRLLRAHTTLATCQEREDDTFEWTPLGALIVNDDETFDRPL